MLHSAQQPAIFLGLSPTFKAMNRRSIVALAMRVLPPIVLLLLTVVAVVIPFALAKLSTLSGSKGTSAKFSINGYVGRVVSGRELLKVMGFSQRWEEVSVGVGHGRNSLLLVAKRGQERQFFEFGIAGQVKSVQAPEREWFPILDGLRKSGFIEPVWPAFLTTPSAIVFGIGPGTRVPVRANLGREALRRNEQGRWPVKLMGRTILSDPGANAALAIDHDLVLSHVRLGRSWICVSTGSCSPIENPRYPVGLPHSQAALAGAFVETTNDFVWAEPYPSGGINVIRFSLDVLTPRDKHFLQQSRIVVSQSFLYSRVSDIEPIAGRYVLTTDVHKNHFAVNVSTGERELLGSGEGTPLFITSSLDAALDTALGGTRR